MKILFLTNLLPYPTDNGGKIKTFATLTALHNSGSEVTLLCFTEKESLYPQELLNLCEDIEQVPSKLTTADYKSYMIKLAVRTIFHKLPLNIYKFRTAYMQNAIEARKQDSFDCIYFDHLPMCVYIEKCKNLWPDARMILDEHNCEANILARNAEQTKNILKRGYLKLQTSKLKRFEAESILSVDKTIVLSDVDYNSLREMTGREFSHVIIPIGVEDKGVKKDDVETEVLNILFVGTLTWEPNNQGLIWFLDEVIPLLEESGINYHLYIVGKNPSETVKSKTNHHVTVTGYVESVDVYYDICHIMVVPLFIGSGQRVKLIEAFSKGMPSISTSVGAEGLDCEDGNDVLIANNAVQFIEKIEMCLNADVRENLSTHCRKLYEEKYSIHAVQQDIVFAVVK